jgi:hypothetical protein
MLSVSEQTCFRIFLQECLLKLDFLDSSLPHVPVSVSVHTNELTKHVGDQISTLIVQQAELEEKFRDLNLQKLKVEAAQTETVDYTVKYNTLNTEINETAKTLSLVNSALAEILRENPDVAKNKQKLLDDRSRLIRILKDALEDIEEYKNFEKLAKLVAEDLTEIEKLPLLKKRISKISEENSYSTSEIEFMKKSIQLEYIRFESKREDLSKILKDKQERDGIDIDYFGRRLAIDRDSKKLELDLEIPKLKADLEQSKQDLNKSEIAHEKMKIFRNSEIENIGVLKNSKCETLSTEITQLNKQVAAINEKRSKTSAELEILRKRRSAELAYQEEENFFRHVREENAKYFASKNETWKFELLADLCKEYLQAKKAAGKKKKKKSSKK